MMRDMNTALQRPLADASAVLARLRSLFDAGVLVLARHCLENGRLSARRLDAAQVPSFEMAWAGAELLAAETAIAALTPDSDPLDARLALVFTVDAVVSLLDRLDAMLAETGEDPAAVDALRAAPEWRALRRAVGGAEALQVTGRGVVEAQGLVGDIAAHARPLSLADAQSQSARSLEELLAELDAASKTYSTRQWKYAFEEAGHVAADFQMLSATTGLVIERDDMTEGSGNVCKDEPRTDCFTRPAKFKRVYKIDFAQADADGFVKKVAFIDLTKIANPQRLAKLAKNVAAEASNFLMGRTFLDIDMQRAADLRAPGQGHVDRRRRAPAGGAAQRRPE